MKTTRRTITIAMMAFGMVPMIPGLTMGTDPGSAPQMNHLAVCSPRMAAELSAGSTSDGQPTRGEACSANIDTIPVVRTPLVLIEPNREPVTRQRPIIRKGIAPEVLEFLRLVHAKIAEVREYPPNAIKLGLQGITTVKIQLMPDGNAHALRIRKTSGHGMLDEAAFEAVQKALPLKPPPEAGNRPLELDIPISFALR